MSKDKAFEPKVAEAPKAVEEPKVEAVAEPKVVAQLVITVDDKGDVQLRPTNLTMWAVKGLVHDVARSLGL